MSKYIFDEAIETLLSVGATFIAVPCNPIGLENSDMIHLRNATQEYESEISKVEKALLQAQKQEKLLELYKELITVKDDLFSYCEIVDDEFYDIRKKETDLEKQIKELEE